MDTGEGGVRGAGRDSAVAALATMTARTAAPSIFFEPDRWASATRPARSRSYCATSRLATGVRLTPLGPLAGPNPLLGVDTSSKGERNCAALAAGGSVAPRAAAGARP